MKSPLRFGLRKTILSLGEFWFAARTGAVAFATPGNKPKHHIRVVTGRPQPLRGGPNVCNWHKADVSAGEILPRIQRQIFMTGTASFASLAFRENFAQEVLDESVRLLSAVRFSRGQNAAEILPSIEAEGACRQVCSWALSGHWLDGEDVHAAPTVDPNSWIGP